MARDGKMGRGLPGKLALTLGALGLAGAIWYGLQPQPIPVDLASVSSGPLLVSVDEEGVTRIREVFRVSAPVSGQLQRIDLEVGDPVEKGKTVLASLAPLAPAFQDVRSERMAAANVRSAEAALRTAEADLRRMAAEQDYAERDFARIESLYRRRVTSQKNYEQTRLRLATARESLRAGKAGVEVRRQELQRARAGMIQPGAANPQGGAVPAENQCCVSVRAPVAGRILKLLQKSEQAVTAGTALMEIGDPRDLEITVDLLSRDAVKVREGAAAAIENWGGEEALKARVRRIEPAGFMKISALGIEEQRVRVVLDLISRPEQRPALGHDFRIFARIEVWKGEKVLQAPLSALFREQAEWAVFLVEEGVARMRKVKLGHRSKQAAQILEGLGEGDQVITHPSDRVKDGVQVLDRKDFGP